MPAFRVDGIQPREPLPDEPFHVWRLPDGRLWAAFHRRGPEYLIRFPELADFLVSGSGTEVRCRPAPDVTLETVNHLFENQVRPLVLTRQGRFVLHASAVDLGIGAVAFLGRSGRGKSTLAVGVARRGFQIVTDDGLELGKGDAGFEALPGGPSVRLWEDSREALAEPDARLAPAVQYTTKVRILGDDRLAFADGNRRLLHAYLIGPGEASGPITRRVAPSDALVEFVRHCFLLDLDEAAVIARQFHFLSDVAQEVPLYVLDYPRRYEDLGATVDALLVHTESVTGCAVRPP